MLDKIVVLDKVINMGCCVVNHTLLTITPICDIEESYIDIIRDAFDCECLIRSLSKCSYSYKEFLNSFCSSMSKDGQVKVDWSVQITDLSSIHPKPDIKSWCFYNGIKCINDSSNINLYFVDEEKKDYIVNNYANDYDIVVYEPSILLSAQPIVVMRDIYGWFIYQEYPLNKSEKCYLLDLLNKQLLKSDNIELSIVNDLLIGYNEQNDIEYFSLLLVPKASRLQTG